MRTVLKIARNELYQLFYSPIAWLLLVVFLVQPAIHFFDSLEHLSRLQSFDGSLRGGLTSNLFSGAYSTLGGIVEKAYLYIPLLTMGLIGKEVASGTIRLLLSSPVKVQWIVWGKYLAITVFNLLLVSIAGIFMLLTSYSLNTPDTGLMWSGLLGLFLLLSAFGAIGLFISSLSEYQIVAALGTLILFAAMSYLRNVWQEYDFIRDLTYYLSLEGRVQQFLEGLISTKNLLYYLLIILLFIGFTIIRLRKLIIPASRTIQLVRYSSLVLVVMVIGYFSSRPGWVKYFDNTATRAWTLGPEIQQILHSMNEGPLNITCYVNILDNTFHKGAPARRISDLENWESYQWFKTDIHINYVYYYDSVISDEGFYKQHKEMSLRQVAEKRAKSNKMKIDRFKTPEEMQSLINLKPELNSYVIQLEYQGAKCILRTFNDLLFYPGPAETGAALKRLLDPNVPRIAFLEGHFERPLQMVGDRGFNELAAKIKSRRSLVNQGFDFVSLRLDSTGIPENINAVVIADPRSDFTTLELQQLQRYIDGGGNLLILGEPEKQSILNGLLEKLGLQLMEGQMVQQDVTYSPDYLQAGLSEHANSIYGQLAPYLKYEVGVSMPGVVPISPLKGSPFKFMPVVLNDPSNSWYTRHRLVTDSAVAQFSPEKGDLKLALPLAATLSRKFAGKEQRIAVVGDADFLSNIELNKPHPATANFSLGTGLLSWLCYGEYPVRISKIPPEDNRVTITDKTFSLLYYLVLFALPGILLLTGGLILLRRRKY
ncbi:Gldg family protein [Pseudobacter ginsenosidimutans]|uniref:ABC-2 type transport system permease protein n=1 Tax=Pseudobacter ginsenosidimutans TaxID=661488 RepID=A0A4Q7N3D8_9BACT|nr:Gldg family protein [Pseudobacter ginsenosidimutans]QEC43573.1 ABC transporter permease subunit [Pseudobacter ginsenosidimutans]RZS74968.1 ABC-2 type transport system permease protein [Pseudobacter ginsenosidimutans]